METAAILLVEDNEDDAILIQCALENAAIHNPVQWVKTADMAIDYLRGEEPYADRARHPLPKVVFVDLRLPGKSGHEVLNWMKKREDLRQIVRVVLTGSDDPNDLKRAYELGANCFVRKPLTPKQLTHPSRNIRMLLSEPPVSTGSVAA